MKYFSMFSGIGGFELGIQNAYAIGDSDEGNANATGDMPNDTSVIPQAGRQRPMCIGYSEIDKHAIKTFEEHFGKEVKNYGDATTIDTRELPDFDLLVGGFPCQAFSVAGKRRGFEDTRGTLFFDVARVLRDKRPRHFILENVKGLLSHDGGKTFSTILKVLTDTGYDVSWSIHNSKNYGVPQNRERVYIIGSLRGTPRPQVFPFSQGGEQTYNGPIIVGSTNNAGRGERARIYHPKGITATLTATDYKQPKQILQLNNPTHSNDRIYGDEGISPTLNTMQGGRRQPKIAIPIITPDRPNKRQNGRRMKDNGEPAFTVTAQDKHGVFDGVKIRRLTPLECERLQGFPDGWTVGSDTQRYKQCGNAITVNVVTAVVSQMKEVIA